MARPSKYNYSDADRLILEGVATDLEISRQTGIPRTSIIGRRASLKGAKGVRETATVTSVLKREAADAQRAEAQQATKQYLNLLKKTERAIAPISHSLLSHIARHAQSDLLSPADISLLSQSVVRLQESLSDSFGETQRAILTLLNFDLMTLDQSADLFNALTASQESLRQATQQILQPAPADD